MVYNEEMQKKNKTAPVLVRFDVQTKNLLEKEGKAIGLDLATYIRHLVFTHQDREKKKDK